MKWHHCNHSMLMAVQSRPIKKWGRGAQNDPLKAEYCHYWEGLFHWRKSVELIEFQMAALQQFEISVGYAISILKHSYKLKLICGVQCGCIPMTSFMVNNYGSLMA